MSEKTMKEKEYYAHSLEGKPPEEWQRLEDHLNEVAEVARTFANDFNVGDWAYLAALRHGSQLRRIHNRSKRFPSFESCSESLQGLWSAGSVFRF